MSATLLTTVQASTHSGVMRVYSGSSSNYTCAQLADFSWTCWGTNNRLGPPSFVFENVVFPNKSPVFKITTGDGFACALHEDGTISCWGSNDLGQLGDGTVTAHAKPAPVLVDALDKFDNVVDVSAGGLHACAVKTDTKVAGSVWCWGSNSTGQLGNFKIADTTIITNPVQVIFSDSKLLVGIATVSAGEEATCGMFTADSAGATAGCWGANADGQLGNGTISDFEVSPVTVFVPGPIALTMSPYTLELGSHHGCAMIPNSTLGCWGGNSAGATSTNIPGVYPWPATVYNGPKIVSTALSLSVGGVFTCAILNDASAACWGANSSGEIGHFALDRANAFSPYPVVHADGSSLSGLTMLVSGAKHACALDSNHQVFCWGDNRRAQLGQDMFVTDTDYPTPVPLDAPIFTDNFESD